jgi:hypothetical protein
VWKEAWTDFLKFHRRQSQSAYAVQEARQAAANLLMVYFPALMDSEEAITTLVGLPDEAQHWQLTVAYNKVRRSLLKRQPYNGLVCQSPREAELMDSLSADGIPEKWQHAFRWLSRPGGLTVEDLKEMYGVTDDELVNIMARLSLSA